MVQRKLVLEIPENLLQSWQDTVDFTCRFIGLTSCAHNEN